MIVQGGEVHGALVAEKTELEFVCVVAVGYLDAGQASLVDAVAGIARLSHEAVADLWNVLDRSIEINLETCDWVFDAGGIATKYQDWVWQEGGGEPHRQTSWPSLSQVGSLGMEIVVEDGVMTRRMRAKMNMAKDFCRMA